MGSTASNFIPSNTGQSLGSTAQRWQVYGATINGQTITSGTAGIASTGQIRLAATDTINWPGLALGQTAASGTIPAGALEAAGSSGVAASAFISQNGSPSSTGLVRLSATDTVTYRNHAGTGDLIALDPNSDDSLSVGNSTISFSSAAANIRFGGTTSLFPMLKRSLISLNVRLADDSADGNLTCGALTTSGAAIVGTTLTAGDSTLNTLIVNGVLTNYNSAATAGNGMAVIAAQTILKSETGADANVLTFTPSIGVYRVTFCMTVSAANTATLGWTLSWSDKIGNAHTPTNLALFQAGTAAPALTFATSSAGVYYATLIVDVSSNPMVAKITFAGTSYAALASVIFERIN